MVFKISAGINSGQTLYCCPGEQLFSTLVALSHLSVLNEEAGKRFVSKEFL
ncbi:MAG: hypothetical protein R2744_08325 [Bacteroidales bacterium]